MGLGSTTLRPVSSAAMNRSFRILGSLAGALIYVDTPPQSTLGRLWSVRGPQGPVQKLAEGYQLNALIGEGRIWLTMRESLSAPYVLYTSDASKQGLTKVKDLGISQPASPSLGLETGGTLFFVILDLKSSRHGLWATNGTAAGTRQITTTPLGFGTSNRPGEIWLIGPGSSDKEVVWYSDGTTAGTYEVGTRHNVPPLGNVEFPQTIGGRLSIIGSSPQNGTELYIEKPGAARAPFGRSCGMHGTWLDSTAPRIGKTLQIEAHDAPANAIGALFLGADAIPSLPLSKLGGPGCYLYVDPGALALLYPFARAQAHWQLPVAIPQDPGLFGIRLTMQALYFRPQALEASAALQATIGR